MTDISELRSYERYVLKQQVKGSFGSVEITIVNLSEQGAQIEHAQPLRVAMTARLWFKAVEVSVSAHGLVVWSRLSKNKSPDGKLLFRSGLRIEEGADEFRQCMQELLNKGAIEVDAESLDRKRKLKEEREQHKTATVRVMRIEDEVPADQALLVTHTRDRLRADSNEAMKWYNRAYGSLRSTPAAQAAELRKHSEEAMAIWEYLERSVPITTITKVLTRSSK